MKKRYLQWYLLAVMCTVMVTVFAGRSFAQTWTGRQTTINSNIGGYYEYLPVGYDGAKKYPIIIFLHGYGELGNGKSQLNRLTTVGLPLLISNGGFPSSVNVGGQNYSFIVIAPQFINWPSANDVDNMITYALSNYSVDQSRIYLTGLSMGGGGTWDHAGSSVARASRLAAILPICGASTPNVPAQQNIATAKLPVLATHNMDDGVVTVNNTIGYVDGINSLGANPAAIKVLWPTVGHNAWTGTYDPTLKFVNGTMNVYEWMLQYTRSVSPPPPAPLVATISSNTPVRCNSQANGSAAVTVAGGVSPYTYSWNSSPAQTSATATGLAAGNYTVTVRDAMGTSTSASVTISQPAPLSITATAGTISTFGGTTSVTLAAAGGTAPYTFTGPTANVAAGTYTYTVTDANGCAAPRTITITQPAAPSAIALAMGKQDVSCFGNSNGSVTVNPSGGMAPYTYSWNTSPVQTTATATNLTAGTYTVTVKDANNSTVTGSVTVLQPEALLLSASAGVITVPGGTTNVTLSAGGGTAPYTFSGPTTSVSVGTYNYTVTDSKGCVDAKTLSITGASPSSPLNIVSLSHNDVTCAGLSNGRASVSVTGGKPPYAYAWTTSTPQASASATNLAAGNYTVTVRDADGQTISSTVTIKTPSPITLQATANTIKKIGGTTDVQLAANGGSAPYAYTGNVSGLKAGTYSFQVKDANGCSTSASVDVKEPSVALSGFTLATLNNTIQVKWATSNEFAIARFEIEKAKDDKTFSGVGNYLALGAANSATSYNSIDGNDVEGNNLYKLFAVTSFGEKVYLGEKKLFFDNRGSVSIKNLTRRIDITVNSNRQEQINVVVYDILGRPVTQIVENKQNNTLRITIAMDTYKNGVYVVKVTGASGMQSVKQIVKQ
jgi:poly(3-hydroxybutyrate) depolymerase